MYKFFKRLFDFVFSLLAIILLAPALAAIFIMIKLTSPGPAVFVQERAGKDAKPFTLYKFRTMKTDTDPFGASPKSEGDPRLTSIGRFLREYSLDELPQLFNILKGDMSIVGPRPLYVAQIAEWNQTQKRRLLVKPGLTGLAQISGRGELTLEAKLAMDVDYVERAGFWTDVKIVMATIGLVFGKTRIYEKNYSETVETRGDNTDWPKRN
jgi:lipopolysaccharide/colanic/teichoic acid biosynthesis glycosyltransferase